MLDFFHIKPSVETNLPVSENFYLKGFHADVSWILSVETLTQCKIKKIEKTNVWKQFDVFFFLKNHLK